MTATHFTALCARLGADADLQDASRTIDLVVDAPAGYQWRDGGVHALRATAYIDGAQTRARALTALRQDAADRMAVGLDPCPATCDCRDEAGS